MRPTYYPPEKVQYLMMGSPEEMFDELLATVRWEERTETRSEAFMSDPPGISYTYGKGKGERTYESKELHRLVGWAMRQLNLHLNGSYNGAFLNLYKHERQHLGWHADDFDRMDQNHPVAVVSFGEPREIWWKRSGETDIERQLLEPGSLFVMPAGFQKDHVHRIPKAGHSVGPRISLTFRRFL